MKPINEMTLEEIEARLVEITSEVETRDGLELENLKSEVIELHTRAHDLVDLQERTAIAEELEAREIEPEAVVEIVEEIKPVMEEKRMFDIKSKEYRDAFYGMISGTATAEQRGIFADGSAYGDGMALPVGLDEQIWDQVHSAHPILADVAKINAGMAIKVTRVTPSAVTKAKDSATKGEQTETHVEVTLVGADYFAKMKLSYAEAKMSQGAMEQFLVQEVAAAVGEALAKDVFARILSDAGTGQKVTATTSVYADIASALALATAADNAVIYANTADYYKILGAVDSNGQPIVRDGVALNAILKKDNAATKITVVDPKKFVLDVIMDTMVKVSENEDFDKVVSALCRAEGTLRNTKAAAYIG